MKKSIPVRIATALAGLVLLALAAAVAAEAFFPVCLTAAVQKLLASRAPLAVLITVVSILVLIALAGSCWMMLTPAKPTRKRGFVMQKSENGPIGISVKAIEGLVRSCVQQQEAIDRADIAIAECRDGINILLSIDQASGVNIPLSVGVLQKQVKQYVTACTGVDVHEVRVLVESNDTVLPASPFAVQDAAPVPVVEQPVEAPAETAPVAAEPVVESVSAPEEAPGGCNDPASQPTPAAPAPTTQPVPAAVPPMMTAIPAVQEEMDDRPLHQRLFGAEEQPAIVPTPPELVIEHEEFSADVEEAEAPEMIADTEVADIAEDVSDEAAETVEAVETVAAAVTDPADETEQEA